MSGSYSDIPDVVRVRMGDRVEAWERLGFRYYAFPHPLYPVDPAIVRAFKQEIDPAFVEGWVRNTYRRPDGGVVHMDRHCVLVGGHETDRPATELTTGKVLLSANHEGLSPRVVFDILEGPPQKGRSDIPGPYLPLDWAYFREQEALACQLRHDQLAGKSEEEISEGLQRARGDRQEKFWSGLKAEQDYRWDHDWATITGARTFYI